MDDTVRSLIRFVARGFYPISCVLIIDAVILHSVLSEDDLNYLLGIQRKELRSLCNKLIEDRLLSQHIQKEENTQSRLMTRTYYYIHVTEAIDSIKLKVHTVVSRIKEEMTRYGNPQGYICPRCGKQISQIDAISLLSDDKTSFICDTCGGTLMEDDSNKQASIRQAKLEKLMDQIDPIISYLKKIDDTHIEDNTFESSLFKSVPAQSSTAAAYSFSGNMLSRSNANLSNSTNNVKSQATLHVSITANDENYEKEQQAREERRQKLQQNALPSWHSAGSIPAEANGNIKDEYNNYGYENESVSVKKENVDEQGSSPETKEGIIKSESTIPDTKTSEVKDQEAQDALMAYYDDLAKREQENAEVDLGLDDDEDEDDDDIFEDLDI